MSRKEVDVCCKKRMSSEESLMPSTAEPIRDREGKVTRMWLTDVFKRLECFTCGHVRGYYYRIDSDNKTSEQVKITRGDEWNHWKNRSSKETKQILINGEANIQMRGMMHVGDYTRKASRDPAKASNYVLMIEKLIEKQKSQAMMSFA